MNKHCLVTGGAGFIGSHLIDTLLERGYTVTAIDNLSTGTLSNLTNALLHPRFQFIQADASDYETMDALISECQVLYHFASIVGVSAVSQSSASTILNNIKTIETIYQLVKKHRPQFMLSSTSEIYGQALAYQENPEAGLSEESMRVYGNTHINRWSYSGIKAIEEFLTLALYQEHQIHASIVRFFNVTGTRQCVEQGMVIPRFIHQALNQLPITLFGDGNQTRCFTAVKDAVHATIQLMETPKSAGEAFNVGGNAPISMRELAEMVLRITQSASPIEYISYENAFQGRYQDISIRIPNTDKLRNTIDFAPSTNLEHIIAELAADFSSQPVS